ncbi:anti-anti-sigma factor [Amycolatopsis arida]|uniref:Anti-sigma factor antagonist n=1 Tax=Amycolatopsis arida TaxID=587909 RepID=A0A1I5L336_9PSEU|nr:STAS domain-containing protein [Amycolatopsis arida]TDX93564.1 anti-anti-sigma factor [Amycolatopsis arida]SFO91675.1 anti-anti-sigma factor [Amycolatopsis arida]
MSVPGLDAQTPGFRITTTAENGVWRVAVSGELDLLTSPQLQEKLTSVVDERPAKVLADLTEVTFFDSSALNALLQVQRHAQENSVEMAVLASSAVERVITLAGVDEHLTWKPAPN